MLDIPALERWIDDQRRASGVPGLAVAVVQGHDVIYARGFGLTSVEDGGTAVTPQTLFRLASATKPLTGTAVMRLVDKGILDLDRPVRAYVPWFTVSDRAASEQITLRMLLSHTSGLPNDLAPFDGSRRDPEGLEMFVRERVPRLPLIAPPGAVYAYSNAGINVAGYVTEAVSGISFADLMRTLVFEPLHMHRTMFDPTVAMTYPLAQGHHRLDDGTLRVQHRFFDSTADNPCGGAFSTVLDLFNLAIMHLSGGRFQERQILSPAAVAAMQTQQVDFHQVTREGYGLTYFLGAYKGHRHIGHGGGLDAFGSSLTLFPDERVAVIVVSNNRTAPSCTPYDVMMRIADQLFDDPLPEARAHVGTPDRSLWPAYSGLYLDRHRGLVAITVVNNRLTLSRDGQTIPLNALTADLYYGAPSGDQSLSVGFVFVAQERRYHVMVDGDLCTRLEAVTIPDPRTWAAYSGTYSGHDTLRCRIVDGRLFIYSAMFAQEGECRPLTNTCFTTPWPVWGVVEFHVADDGSVSTLMAGWSVFLRTNRG